MSWARICAVTMIASAGAAASLSAAATVCACAGRLGDGKGREADHSQHRKTHGHDISPLFDGPP